VRTLGLGNEEEWKTYSRSGKKPDDIPAAPRQVYGSAFVSLDDWLGTDRVASYKQLFR